MATAIVAMTDTTTAMTVVVGSPVGTIPVAHGTSISAVDVVSASFANGRLPAVVPLTVTLSAAYDKGYAYIVLTKCKI